MNEVYKNNFVALIGIFLKLWSQTRPEQLKMYFLKLYNRVLDMIQHSLWGHSEMHIITVILIEHVFFIS